MVDDLLEVFLGELSVVSFELWFDRQVVVRDAGCLYRAGGSTWRAMCYKASYGGMAGHARSIRSRTRFRSIDDALTSLESWMGRRSGHAKIPANESSSHD